MTSCVDALFTTSEKLAQKREIAENSIFLLFSFWSGKGGKIPNRVASSKESPL